MLKLMNVTQFRQNIKNSKARSAISDHLLYCFAPGGEATRPGTAKRCSHNLQSDPLGSGFKEGRENSPLLSPVSAARVQC